MTSNQMPSNIYFYSERGLVDALVLDLNDCMNNGNKKIVQDFFRSIDMYKDNTFPKFELGDGCKIDWYIEPNLGASDGFGTPDLIVKIKDKEKQYLVFFEAKLTSFSDNSVTPTSEGDKIFHNIGSKLNIQLFYKYLFSATLLKKGVRKNPESNEDEIFIKLTCDRSNPNTRSYRLQKKELLTLYRDLFNRAPKDTLPPEDNLTPEIFYIALTNEEKKPGNWKDMKDKELFNYFKDGVKSDPKDLVTIDSIETEFLTHLGCLNYAQFIKGNLTSLKRLNAYKTSEYHFNGEWPDCLEPTSDKYARQRALK